MHSKSQTKAHIHQRTLANTFKQFEKAVLHAHLINMSGEQEMKWNVTQNCSVNIPLYSIHLNALSEGPYPRNKSSLFTLRKQKEENRNMDNVLH